MILVEKKQTIFAYEKAWDFLDAKNKDSAFFYFNTSKIEFTKNKDSLGIAKSLMNMAIIQNEAGDYFGSQENAIEAIKILEKIKDTAYISTTYNILGTNGINLKDYKESVKYLRLAIEKTNSNNDKEIFQNNLAICYGKQKQYDSAIITFKKIISKKKDNKALLIDNLAYLYWKKNNQYNAESEMLKALTLRKNNSDLWGQNASHAHLSDYFEEKNPEKSLFHAQKMYEIAKTLKSPDDELEALQKLINLDNAKQSKKYFKIFQNLNDSLQTSRNKAKNQFALIRYDAEKNRADLQKVQTQNTQKNYQLFKNKVVLYSTIFISIIGALISLIWQRKRKKRLDQEKELEIKNTELKYSKKVHDVVANGIYKVMTEVENLENFDKNMLLDKLENIYEKSRDISYDNALKTPEENYVKEIYLLLHSFSSEKIQIFIIGNEEHTWKNICPKIKSEINLILQELLINMKKHSFATKVSVKFDKTEDTLRINYFDDGIGLPKENFILKNGLKNMENRIFACLGMINFDQNIEKGTKITLEIPLEKKQSHV